MVLYPSSEHVESAKPGDLWEISGYWVLIAGKPAETYILTRHISGDTWDSYCLETGRVCCIVISSQLYEHVAS